MWLFASACFLSAFLLFQMQLIVGKWILPWFGGSAAVWTTSLLVFQVLLLVGYLYSHVISARFSVRGQTWVHGALLLVAFFIVLLLFVRWPSAITPSSSWKVDPSGYPMRDVATIIMVSAGFPFFILSTTAPLLQRWFAHLGGGMKTYKLYSISNLGSLAGLLTFPFLFEPIFRLKTQGTIWTLLFFGFLVGCGICVWETRRTTDEATTTESDFAVKETSLLTYSLWFLLAACPASLLLVTTSLLCQEVTTVPLLWVLPLAVYLLSFILCFDSPRWYRRWIFHPLFAIGLFLTCVELIVNDTQTEAFLLPILLFLGCMTCNGELVHLKPKIKHLTSFYLIIAAGGAAGSVFAGIAAPHLFKSFTEFQLTLGLILVLVLVCLSLDSSSWIFDRTWWLPAVITLAAILVAYLDGEWLPGVAQLLERLYFFPLIIVAGMVSVLGAYVLEEKQREKSKGLPRRHEARKKALAREPGFRVVQVYVGCIVLLAMATLYRSTLGSPEPYLSARNFYGALHVYRVGPAKVLTSGHTLHGAQLDPPNDKEPISYYGKPSGIGIVLQNHPKRAIPGENLRVGLLGLGTGTLAAYGQRGDVFQYYELNPAVVKLSTGSQPVFTYLRDSAAHVTVELGDGRLLLEKELITKQLKKFDVLVLDAFSGDAIPVHLLTKEAFGTYWECVDPNHGIIAVHVTSQHVDLLPVLQGVSASFNADALVEIEPTEYPYMANTWVLIALHPGALAIPGLEQDSLSSHLDTRPILWTDDYSSILRLIRW
jgi:hypothetical protein